MLKERTGLRRDCDDWLFLPRVDEVVVILMKGIVIPPTNILLHIFLAMLDFDDPTRVACEGRCKPC